MLVPNYQKLYTLLFNAFTDAIEELERCNYGSAREILICAQQNAEMCYLDDEEEELSE